MCTVLYDYTYYYVPTVLRKDTPYEYCTYVIILRIIGRYIFLPHAQATKGISLNIVLGHSGFY